MRVTILIATAGRPTLDRTLRSIAAQDLRGDDEVLLVHDGLDCEQARHLWRRYRLPGRFAALSDGPHGDWGHTPRNRMMSEARGDYLMHLDDDDALAPDAVATVRSAAVAEPGDLFMFRMRYANGFTLWGDKAIRIGNVGTPMFVHPAAATFGTWLPEYGGDGNFIRETVEQNAGRRLHWRREVIALIRPG